MLESLRAWSRQLRGEIEFWRECYRDPRTPRLARWLIGLALFYLLCPIDIIPDFIPVLGQLDDVVIVGLLLFLAHRLMRNRPSNSPS